MSSAGRPTSADIDLAERLGARGITATPGRLRHLRSEAQIPGPDRQPDGRYLYSAAAEEYSAELLELLAIRRDLALATLALFGRGRAPRERALKNAYETDLRRWAREIDRVRRTGSTPLDDAYAVVEAHESKLEHSALGRSMRERIRRLQRQRLMEDDPEAAILQSATVQPYHIALTGEPASEAGLVEFFEATGVGAIVRDRWAGSGPIAAEVVDGDLLNVLRGIRLDSYAATIRSASVEQLISARDAAASLVQLVTTAAQVFRFMTPLPDAFGFAALSPTLIKLAGAPFGNDLVVGRYAPLMLVIKEHVPSYEEGVATLVANLPVLRAQAGLATFLPAEFRGAHGMQKLQRLPKDEQRRLIREWATAHPQDAQLAGVDLTLL